jgi:predicted RNase H-like HicB family nuclease
MTEYTLYLESGPRRRKTMIHVLDLLGCIAQGASTEEALEATPEGIRAYLRFLHRHGEAVDPRESFTTTIAQHIMEGPFLGQGDPTPGFPPDFQPLSTKDLETYRRRFTWLGADLLELVRDVRSDQLVAETYTGRSIQHILEHVAGAQGVYLRYLVGRVDGLPTALKAAEQGPDTIRPALSQLWQICSARLEVLTPAEREQHVPHGQVTWTARRALRRMLEHGWEHHQEIAARQTPSPSGRGLG